jgi:glycosyltransferase involved in cell wall biosynthesis
MKVAVLTVTRDRFAYSQYCFAALREFAGCEYDHFVFDNGSQDYTPSWLEKHASEYAVLTLSDENVGLSQAFNFLLGYATEFSYDVIVKMDNDCQLVMPNTLRDVCGLAAKGNHLLSPRILGLRQPPQPQGEAMIDREPIILSQVGGIFMAAPAATYDEFRASEHSPSYGYEDVQLNAWVRERGGIVGYVERLEAWHYERVDEQEERYPDYQERKMRELA